MTRFPTINLPLRLATMRTLWSTFLKLRLVTMRTADEHSYADVLVLDFKTMRLRTLLKSSMIFDLF